MSAIMPAEHLAETISRAAEKLGFSFFTSGAWNVNYWGIRNPNPRAGYFDDSAVFLWQEQVTEPGGQRKLEWRAFMAPLTTDPGRTYLHRPINVHGTALLSSPQQMKGAYKIGVHKGYRALVQAKPVKVWRDNNRDSILDWEPGEEGIPGRYGINHHRGAPQGISKTADYYSAGCQVYEWVNAFLSMMDIMARTTDKYGPLVTYTLVDARELGLTL
jgi:hypothetical protein